MWTEDTFPEDMETIPMGRHNSDESDDTDDTDDSELESDVDSVNDEEDDGT